MAKLDYSVDIHSNLGKDALTREGAVTPVLLKAAKQTKNLAKKAKDSAPAMLDKAKGIAKENVPFAENISKLSKSKVGLGLGMTALAVAPVAMHAASDLTAISDTAPYAGASKPMQTNVSALTNNNTNTAYSDNVSGITNATYH